jgi:hypothetical protein
MHLTGYVQQDIDPAGMGWKYGGGAKAPFLQRCVSLRCVAALNFLPNISPVATDSAE